MKKILCYLLLIFKILSKKISSGLTQDLTGKYFPLNYGNNDILQEQTGYDKKLECGGIKGHHTEYIEGTVIKWYFKSCGQNLNQKPCQYSYYDDWTNLPCDNNICNSTLFLKNITEENSGLYKCTIYPYKPNELTTLDIQLVQTFQLYIRNTTILPPQFFDELPKNMTAKIDDQIVFQCRVYSKEPPTIGWFKRIHHDNNNNNGYDKNQYSTTIPYLQNTYEFLKSAGGIKVLTDDLYLSKLILNSMTKPMEGFYACVPINSRGHKIREAYLSVIDENNNEDNMKYISLFLMPIGLAFLPLSFWLCFVCRKKCIEKRSNSVREDEETTLRIFL